MEYQLFNEILKKFPETRILCVGDIMLDRFIYGDVERISPEGPIPVLKVNRENSMLGGVGNVVSNVAALSAKVDVVSVIGDDDAGNAVKLKVGTLSSDTEGLVICPVRPTTIKTRYLASNQQLLRTDAEHTTDASLDVTRKILERAYAKMDACDVVVLSDYGKGVLTDEIIESIIKEATARNKPVIVDPKGSDYTKYRGASLVTPNRSELSQATSMTIKTDNEVRAASLKVIYDCGIKSVLATRSQDGMSVISADGSPVHLPTVAREVFDVSGAGDTVVASMAIAMGCGTSLEHSAYLSNVAAGIVVGKLGTAVVSAQELSDNLQGKKDEEIRSAAQKVKIAPMCNLEQVVECAERWRREGKTVGFANGCFDLLHPGHVSLMVQAAGECDRLIVAMNSDASVKRLKGESRPVQNETSRATVLGALGMVDAVVVFGEETPMNLIKAINPDVLVKGSDYTVETVVGSEHVLSYGGRVFLADLQEGQSTTNTIKKLAS